MRGSGGRSRGYRGRQELLGREEGLQGPSGAEGAGGGPTGAVGWWGDGRTGYRGRQGL